MKNFMIALILALTACGDSGSSTAVEDRIADGSVEVALSGGLVQRVTLRPATLLDGRDVEVRSVLVNRGTAPVDLSSRICGLDYAGTLALTWPPEIVKCAGFSLSGPLAPGDSVVSGDVMRVASEPGQYQLQVRHALSPERWVTMSVTVRAAP